MCLFNKWLQITSNILKHSWLICLKFVCHFLAELYYLILKSSVVLRFSQTCKFWSSKAAFTIAFFAAVNHLNGPLRKQNFTLTGSKGHGLWFVIGWFWSILCVCVFQGSLLVIVIMIDGSEKRNYCEGAFWTLEFTCLWKAQLMMQHMESWNLQKTYTNLPQQLHQQRLLLFPPWL